MVDIKDLRALLGLSPLFIRVQKQRAAQSEDRAEQLQAELMDKDTKYEEVRSQLEEISLRLEKSAKERSQSAAENAALKT